MLATVKVMRSFDYCHFETSLTEECADLDAVNELRKQAALLVDEAVRQYKIAKSKEGERERKTWDIQQSLDVLKAIEKKPVEEWTAQEAAIARKQADISFWKNFHEDDYYYTDPEREHHFSMLRQFQGLKKLKIKA